MSTRGLKGLTTAMVAIAGCWDVGSIPGEGLGALLDASNIPIDAAGDRSMGEELSGTDLRPPDLRVAADLISSCGNRLRDGDETDVDCGGKCGACAEGSGCSWGGDCAGRVCFERRCSKGQIATTTLLAGPMNSAAVTDVTSDGLRDIVIGVPGTRYQTLKRVPGGGFSVGALMRYGSGGGANYLRLVDVDRDGKSDLISGSWLDPNVYVAPGAGAGTFGPAVAYRVTANPKPAWGRSLAPGDFDGDGDVDVAVGEAEEGLVLLRNRGDGSFGVETIRQYGGGVATGDFDRDGISDLALETGPLVKRLSKQIPCGVHVGGDVLVGDFNGDGWLDMGSWLEVCLGDGQGGLLAARPVAGALVQVGARNSASWSGDVNGDGRSDLIAYSRIDLQGPPQRREELLEVALGAANGNLRYSLSLTFDGAVHGVGTGRALSVSRDDLLVGVYDFPGMLGRDPELRILTLR